LGLGGAEEVVVLEGEQGGGALLGVGVSGGMVDVGEWDGDAVMVVDEEGVME
jgi:hypothetical protein